MGPGFTFGSNGRVNKQCHCGENTVVIEGGILHWSSHHLDDTLNPTGKVHPHVGAIQGFRAPTPI